MDTYTQNEFSTYLEYRYNPTRMCDSECHCPEPELADDNMCKHCGGERKDEIIKKKKGKKTQ